VVKSQGLPQAPLQHRVVVRLLVVLDLSLRVRDTQADQVVLEDHLDLINLIVADHLQNQDILMGQAVLLRAHLDLVAHQVALEDLNTILGLEDHHMEVQMVLAQVLMVLLLTELWEDILVLEDPQCQEVQGVLLPAPLEVHPNQDPQVLHLDQAQDPTADQPRIFRNCRTPSTRWRREE